jgi:hypothetical protein
MNESDELAILLETLAFIGGENDGDTKNVPASSSGRSVVSNARVVV